VHVIAPMLDFPRSAFVLRVGLNPFQYFAVAFAFLQFREQPLRVNADEADETLVQWAVVVILAVCAGQRGAALVEHPWQECISAEARARTAGWTLSKVGSAEVNRARRQSRVAPLA